MAFDGALARPELFSIVGVLAGFLAHHGLFIRGEWHVQAPDIVLYHIWTFVCLMAGGMYYRGSAVGDVLNALIWVCYGYLPSLVVSMVLYRFFFHPLTRAGFQGPWYARVTKVWQVWAARKSKNHLVLAKLHDKYGDFVRTGKWRAGQSIRPHEPFTDAIQALPRSPSSTRKSSWRWTAHGRNASRRSGTTFCIPTWLS
jgi:hypothetical protein